jgi:hypothetical protein
MGRNSSLPTKQKGFLFGMDQDSTGRLGVQFIDAIGQELQTGSVRVGFLEVAKPSVIAGQKLRGFDRLHDLKSFGLGDAYRNMFGFEKGVEAFAAKLPTPAALFDTPERSLRRRRQAIVDADNSRFQRFH